MKRLLCIDCVQDLVSWDGSELRNSKSIRGVIGEMVACMGPEVAWQVVVQLG
jgi:arginine-tRNA-protein transferase